MLRALGGGQIKKKTHKNNGGQSQSFKYNNNNNNKIIIIINEKRAIWGTLPWGANENFLAHSNEAESLSATISNICAKIIEI